MGYVNGKRKPFQQRLIQGLFSFNFFPIYIYKTKKQKKLGTMRGKNTNNKNIAIQPQKI